MRYAVLLGAALSFASPSVAADKPAPQALQAGLVGKWTGTLGYRDYQSDKLFELLVTTEIRLVPDKSTVIRVSSFDDGPKTGLVYITSVSLYDTGKNVVATTSFRKGRPVETSTDTVTTVTYTDPTHWAVEYRADGTDNDQPALLRTTETRAGDRLMTIKEVMPKNETAKGWQFRNQTRLERVLD